MKTIRQFWNFNLALVGIVICLTTGCNKVESPVFGGTVTDVEGNVYHTVTIGTQTWMIENLKTAHYADNTAIPMVTDSAAWTNLKTPGYCWYENDSASYKSTYGALYNWYAVKTNKLAPEGWHIPTDAEWSTLEDNVSQYYNVSGSLAKILASTTHWIKSGISGAAGNNMKTNNSSGFAALPGGSRINYIRSFSQIDSVGGWWSSSYANDTSALSLKLANNLSTVERINSKRMCGFSIRCIKDKN
ncbi:MAG TPA: fibrobacter succinogenes major paralogous domain-containing protein [Paludibacter sp.]|nr:fibrobacter succinogenes major paralogous domain-containing protein [Paludibacter sp.]